MPRSLGEAPDDLCGDVQEKDARNEREREDL